MLAVVRQKDIKRQRGAGARRSAARLDRRAAAGGSRQGKNLLRPVLILSANTRK